MFAVQTTVRKINQIEVVDVRDPRDYLDVAVGNGVLVVTDHNGEEVARKPFHEIVRIPAGALRHELDVSEVVAEAVDCIEWESLTSVRSGDLDDFRRALDSLNEDNPLAYMAEQMLDLFASTSTPDALAFTSKAGMADAVSEVLRSHYPEGDR